MSGIFILHVEDNRDDAELMRIAFDEVGFRHKVVEVQDGAKALDFLFGSGEFKGRDPGDAPALVLLDLDLPRVHGLEVLRRLKADPLLKHVLVVVLTASPEDDDRIGAARLGTNLYIQKPSDFTQFTAVARQLANLLAAFKP